jgi:DNA invertase Pin-like site-specific DNA recombinase
LSRKVGQSLFGATICFVGKLVRLGPDLRYPVNAVHNLTARGIGFKVLTGHSASIDTIFPDVKLVPGIFAALAEFERKLIIERTKAWGLRGDRLWGLRGDRLCYLFFN